MIEDNDNYQIYDYICYCIQILIIGVLIFIILYSLFFLFRIVEVMATFHT